MRKLTEVEEARSIMIQGKEWSVMRWLTEKKRVRKAADKANAALDVLEKEVKACWSEDMQAAYNQLSSDAEGSARVKKDTSKIDPTILAFVKKVKEADEEAYKAHMDAENKFDDAERRLSTAMAREGCDLALASWDLHEKAILKAESGIRSSKASS